MLTVLVLLVTGCRKNDLQTNVSPINVLIKVSYEDGYEFPSKDIKVTLTNTVTGAELVQQSDKDGIVIFNAVSPGIYDVQGTTTVDKAIFETRYRHSYRSGRSASQRCAYQAYLKSQPTIIQSNLKLQAGTIGQWVIKQMYYAGSHKDNGATFRDQFLEIYNNSNDTLYADSLYFGQLAGNNGNFATVDLSKPYFINDPSEAMYKGFDWSKSIGISPADASAWKNYVYMKTTFSYSRSRQAISRGVPVKAS